MRRALVAIAGTVAGLVLLLSFKTHPTTAVATPAAAVSTPAPATASGRKAASPAAGTYTGDVSQNQYGPIQVQVTVKNGKVASVTATQSPSGDPRSAQINAYAIPVLNAEATKAGSAHISMVSGATYTSESYLASLQSALSKAGLP